MGWQKRAETWDEYRRLWKRWKMGLERFEPIKPPRAERQRAAPSAASLFRCEVCGSEFTARIALAGHKRSHKVTANA